MKTKKTPKRKPSTPKKKTAEMFLSRKDLEGNYVSATSQLQYVNMHTLPLQKNDSYSS